jgi:hypothetical protein
MSHLCLVSPLAVHLLLDTSYVRFLRTKLFCVHYTKFLIFLNSLFLDGWLIEGSVSLLGPC